MACWDSFPKTYHVEVDYRKLLHKVFLDVIRTHNEYYESAVDISGERLYVGHSLIKHNTSMACNKHTEHIREKAEERLYIFNVKTGLPPHGICTKTAAISGILMVMVKNTRITVMDLHPGSSEVGRVPQRDERVTFSIFHSR